MRQKCVLRKGKNLSSESTSPSSSSPLNGPILEFQNHRHATRIGGCRGAPKESARRVPNVPETGCRAMCTYKRRGHLSSCGNATSCVSSVTPSASRTSVSQSTRTCRPSLIKIRSGKFISLMCRRNSLFGIRLPLRRGRNLNRGHRELTAQRRVIFGPAPLLRAREDSLCERCGTSGASSLS